MTPLTAEQPDPLHIGPARAAPYATPSADSGGGTLPHMTQLDGLRAFAVATVLLQHFCPGIEQWCPCGQIGVKLFFVLSGFLITGILLNCRKMIERTGQSPGLTLRQFYARRFLRIFPIYYATLAFLYVVSPGVRPVFVWHLLYLTNVYIAKTHTFPFLVAHFWTLGVEEQFYLCWPLFVFFVPRRLLLPSVIAMIVAAPLYRLVGYEMGLHWTALLALPFGCLDSLGAGALLALLSDRPLPRPAAIQALSRVGLWIGIPLTVILFVVRFFLFTGRIAMLHLPTLIAVRMDAIDTCLFDMALSLMGFFFVAGAAKGFGGPLGALLRARAIVYVGTISYGIYVLHPVVQGVVLTLLARRGIRVPPIVILFPALTALSIAAATASWYGFERPINALKRFFPYERRAESAATFGKATT